jgi:hypothetical protein
MNDSRLGLIGPGACNPSVAPDDVLRELWSPLYFINGGNLRIRRELAGIGLRELAKALKVSSTYLSRIETAPRETRIGADFASRIDEWLSSAGSQRRSET